MDDEKNNLIHLDKWKERVKESIPAIDEEEEFFEDEFIPALGMGIRKAGSVALIVAYTRGVWDGRAEKWRELRWHILFLILSNLIAIAVIFWLT
jgi:hypothetical protein